MRSIQHNNPSAGPWNALQAAIPARGFQALAHGGFRDRDARLEQPRDGQGEGGVFLLVFPGEGKFVWTVRLRHDRQRSLLPAGGFDDDAQGAGIVGGGEGWNAGLDDAGFFAGDFGQGLAQPLLVVQLHIGNDAGQRGDDIGGIQPPAQARFPDHQAALLLVEILQRHDRDGLEKSGMRLRAQALHGGAEVAGQPCDVFPADEMAVHLDAFGKGNQVRRSEQAHPPAGGAVDAFQHGASRAFAVGARHVDEPQAVLRIAHGRRQAEGVVQAQLHAKKAQAVKVFNGLGIRHFHFFDIAIKQPIMEDLCLFPR